MTAASPILWGFMAVLIAWIGGVFWTLGRTSAGEARAAEAHKRPRGLKPKGETKGDCPL